MTFNNYCFTWNPCSSKFILCQFLFKKKIVSNSLQLFLLAEFGIVAFFCLNIKSDFAWLNSSTMADSFVDESYDFYYKLLDCCIMMTLVIFILVSFSLFSSCFISFVHSNIDKKFRLILNKKRFVCS